MIVAWPSSTSAEGVAQGVVRFIFVDRPQSIYIYIQIYIYLHTLNIFCWDQPVNPQHVVCASHFAMRGDDIMASRRLTLRQKTHHHHQQQQHLLPAEAAAQPSTYIHCPQGGRWRTLAQMLQCDNEAETCWLLKL